MLPETPQSDVHSCLKSERGVFFFALGLVPAFTTIYEWLKEQGAKHYHNVCLYSDANDTDCTVTWAQLIRVGGSTQLQPVMPKAS